MADNTQALTLLASQVRTAASWNTGARESFLNQVADRLDEVANGGPLEWVSTDQAQVDAQREAAEQLQREQEAAAQAAASQQAQVPAKGAQAQAGGQQGSVKV